MWRVERVLSVWSLTVSVVAQKKVADSTYPMGIERWNPTSWSSSGVALGTRNATEWISSSRTQMRISAFARSTLFRNVGPSFGGAFRMQSMTLYRDFPNHIASL